MRKFDYSFLEELVPAKLLNLTAIIYDIKGAIDINKWSNPIINIGAITLITIISAKILFITVNSLFQWYYFKKLESFFI